MRNYLIFTISILILICGNLGAEDKSLTSQVMSPINKFTGFVRYKKYDKALEYLDLETFCDSILKGHDIPANKKREFIEAVKVYIQKQSFPKVHKYFDKIDVNYEKPVEKPKHVEVPASILYEGKEKILFSWILVKKNGKYLIADFLSDVITEGQHASIYEKYKQVEPILQTQGIDVVIKRIYKLANQ
ncbi:MAG: ABC transporter substrate-binding protein [Leptospiraceae bacterium]|nr:ABC transporter substrate-binding protein [Leptospiraceae bacterium]MCP5495959.1 ABC transporter substrate-binding protein [Leptospiraceae bacterium]